jgi:hypothetical protein
MPRLRGIAYLISAGVILIGALLAGSAIGWTTPHSALAQTVPTQVNLAVTLERPNAASPHPSWAAPVHFTLNTPGDAGIPLYAFDLTLDQSGKWQGDLRVWQGTYDLRLKNMHTLRNVKRGVAISSGINTIDMGTLLEGDADDDNRVSSSDFSLLRSAYFTAEGNPGFDPRTDFDEDDRIRSSDFALLRGNYSKTGDIEVSAPTAASQAAPAGTVALELTPARVLVAPGETFIVTLIARAGDQPFVAMDADIRFPPALLQVVGPDGAPATAIQALPPLTELTNQVDSGTGRILFGAGTFSGPVSGDLPLAQIRFSALEAAPPAEFQMIDGTVADEKGKWVTGPLSGARFWVAKKFHFGYLPLILRAN